MNDVIDNIKARRSIRKYLDKRIPEDLIKEIVEAGRFAPSAHNSQPWRFVVIEDKDKIDELSNSVKDWFKKRMKFGKFFGIFNKKIKDEVKSAEKRASSDKDLFFYDAPLVILVCAKDGKFIPQDCALAAENMMLAARSLGIGSCWIGFADLVVNQNRTFMDYLGVPNDCKIMAHLIFGYPEKFPAQAFPRKEEADVVKWLK
ncbi:MAG: nitroreductase family protein [Nanoarchaeota archaeon]